MAKRPESTMRIVADDISMFNHLSIGERVNIEGSGIIKSLGEVPGEPGDEPKQAIEIELGTIFVDEATPSSINQERPMESASRKANDKE